MTIRTPYLLFIGDAPDQLAAKTADGIAFWRRDICLGQLRLPGCKADLRLPDMTVEEGAAAAVKTLIVGTTNRGGVLGEGWEGLLLRAMELGMDLASGLHHRLADIPALRDAASRLGREIHDVRHPTREFAIGNGIKRPGKRLLTVGTDCSIGKMFTALALEKEMRTRGINADFRATGQTGIFIAGDGVSIDAVVSDFVSGAVEFLCPANDPDHWDLIEGQGSLFHASYAGVTLGLIHGAQPDALVMCHEPTRKHMRGLPHYQLPDLKLCIERNIEAAQLTNPAARCVGISVNTAGLDPAGARDYLRRTEDEQGVPCVDAVRTGVGPIVDRLIVDRLAG
ncbi:MAG: N-acetyltransferase DgcN [Alphaproteobacteria bacterium]